VAAVAGVLAGVGARMAAPRRRAVFDRDAEGAADGRADFPGTRARLLGAEHRGQALPGPAEDLLGAAADLRGDRLDKAGEVGIGGDGDQRDV